MFNISMFFYLFNCIKMNKNFLFLLLIILIIGIIVFVYNYKEINQKIKEFFEENYLDNFKFDNNYSKNNIIDKQFSSISSTNYLEIKDYDIDGKILPDFDSEGKQLPNNIFLKFLSARPALRDECNESYKNFIISNSILIQFDKKNQFLEIQFNSKNNSKFLKLNIDSIDANNEKINIEINIDDIKNKYSSTNTNKYINQIEFYNITMKKNNTFLNVFFIKLSYLSPSNEITSEIITDTITKLPDGLDNHFCENLLNVSVYSNPLNKITITNNFLVDIYLENFEPRIKSKRTKIFDKTKIYNTNGFINVENAFELIAFTYNTGRIFRPYNKDPKYGSLGDYMYDERREAYKKTPAWKKAFKVLSDIAGAIFSVITFGASIAISQAAKATIDQIDKNKAGDITYKTLRDALLLSTENEYVIPAEKVGYSWDDDFTNLKNRKKNTSSDPPNALSFQKRKEPLVLFNLHPVEKNGYIYYPLGDFAYVGPLESDTLKYLKENRKNASNDYVFSDKFNSKIPHVLVREDCLEQIDNQGPHMTWWDVGAPTPKSYDGSAGSYWVKYARYNQAAINDANSKDSDNGGYKNSDVNNPGNFLAIFNGAHNMGKEFSHHFDKPRNYKIKKEFLIGQPRPSIVDERQKPIIEAIKVILNENIKATNITQPIINKNVSPYVSQINTDKENSQSLYTKNLNFNKKMENIQKDYDHNFSYITDINTQLSNIRQQEKLFVNNQIKQQLESHKNKIENDLKKQTETLNKYDNDISQTSTTIGNQINEYVVLRKQRELMPTNPQIMY